MTAREQRRRRRRKYKEYERVVLLNAIVVLLIVVYAVGLVFVIKSTMEASTTGQSAGVQTTAGVISEATTPPVTLAPVAEPEHVSWYAGIEISDEDVYTLACLVYHEARGEPFEGQVAVIEVALNRCLSEYFPDTVEEVVFQKYGNVWQFSPAPYLYTAEPGEMQYEAVYTAIEAVEPILPPDTVYFSTAPYNDSIVEIIGNHYFCSIF